MSQAVFTETRKGMSSRADLEPVSLKDHNLRNVL